MSYQYKSIIPFVLLVVLIFSITNTELTEPYIVNASYDFAYPAPDAEAPNIGFAEQIGGKVKGLAIEGNYAYIGQGATLIIMDISNPSNPAIVGRTERLISTIQDIEVVNGIAYIANRWGGLRIIDVSDPRNPIEIGYMDSPEEGERIKNAYHVAIENNRAYVSVRTAGGYDKELQIVDISIPSNPVQLGIFTESSLNNASVALQGTNIYVARDTLNIFNASNPSNVMEITMYDTQGYVYDTFIANNTAYVVDSNGLVILNISNIANPTHIGQFTVSGYIERIAVSNGLAVVKNDERLQIIDISNPSNPTEFGSYILPNGLIEMVIVGNIVYIVDEIGQFSVINISTPTNPSLLSNYNFHGAIPIDVFIEGDIAYVAAGSSGLQIFDITSSSNPIFLGVYDTPGNAEDIIVVNNIAYIADSNSGLQMVDITTPANPVRIGFYNSSNEVGNVVITNDKAYITDNTWSLEQKNKIQILNVSNPSTPVQIGSYETPGRISAVAVQDNFLYLTYSKDYPEYEFQIIDISLLNVPILVGSYTVPNFVSAITISNNKAYLASDGLRIIDVSNPVNPFALGYVATSYSADLSIQANTAYMTSSSGGVWVFDITNSMNPVQLEFYDTVHDRGNGIEVVGNTIYLADHEGGLLALRHLQNTPTPTLQPPTDTPIPTLMPTPPPSQSTYEPNDECNQATNIPTDNTIQLHTFSLLSDIDWVRFDAIAGITYMIEAETPTNSSADVELELYYECGGGLAGSFDETFTPDVQYTFRANRTAPIYLRFTNQGSSVAGDGATYEVLVQVLPEEPLAGAVILLEGRYRLGDPLQDKIHKSNCRIREEGKAPQREGRIKK